MDSVLFFFAALFSFLFFLAGADPFMPEPDLVTMGDGVVVDLASIVNHLNTRGNFELVRIDLDDHCTLRSRSRVQQGVQVEARSMLLEKSLALTGEVMEADTVWQGAPASQVFQRQRESVAPSPTMSFDNQCDFIEFSQIV